MKCEISSIKIASLKSKTRQKNKFKYLKGSIKLERKKKSWLK
jgi:hypothetical protein